MDYKQLAIQIQVPVQQWTMIEIVSWLYFVHLQELIPIFQKAQLNGYLLKNMQNTDLQRIGIHNKIKKLKINNWIQRGFSQFQDYLIQNKENCFENRNRQNQNHTMHISNKQNYNQNRPFIREKFQKKNLNIQPIYEFSQLVNNNSKLYERQEKIMQQQQKKKQSKLILTSYEGNKSAVYVINENGCQLGRSSYNTIQSLQISVQNEHSLISSKSKNFYLEDLSTQSGTYVKVLGRCFLSLGTLVEMGSFLLRVIFIDSINCQINIQLQKNDSDEIYRNNINLQQKKSFCFGRKMTNDFTYDDKHLSGLHARINMYQGKFVIEDMGSTNGTWIRLSDKKMRSIPHILNDGDIIKIGTTISFHCKITQGENVEKKPMGSDHQCIICQNNVCDIVFIPCKHNVSCSNCVCKLQKCPLCGIILSESLQIYIS